jgi:hypothetical protein
MSDNITPAGKRLCHFCGSLVPEAQYIKHKQEISRKGGQALQGSAAAYEKARNAARARWSSPPDKRRIDNVGQNARCVAVVNLGFDPGKWCVESSFACLEWSKAISICGKSKKCPGTSLVCQCRPPTHHEMAERQLDEKLRSEDDPSYYRHCSGIYGLSSDAKGDH